MAEKSDQDDSRDRSRRRLRGFLNHLIGYFGAMAILVPVNVITSPETPWFVVPMVGWGTVLAVHAAYAMGLFQGLRRM